MIGNTEIPKKPETKLVNPIEGQVEEGEQIIGIYGFTREDDAVNCFGFLVWKPPKL